MNNSKINPRLQTLWMATIPQIVILSISIIWILIFPKDSVLKYLHIEFSAVLKGFFIGVVLAFAGYLFYLVAKKVKALYSAVELFERILSPVFKNMKLFDMVFLSTVSGFVEEVFFRGLLFPKAGIIISSIGFGLLHFPGKKYWIYAVWATLSGALFAWLLYTSGSLWVPITAHATNNIIGMLLLNRMARKIN